MYCLYKIINCVRISVEYLILEYIPINKSHVKCVSLIAVLSTAAVTGCRGGCRI